MVRGALKKSVNSGTAFIGILILMLLMVGYCHAQNKKEISGLNFKVPDDWPIEKRNGIIGPIPTGEYLTIKFKGIEEEFQKIKGELSDKFDDLQSDLKNTEADLSKEIENVRMESIRLQSNSQEKDSTDLTEVFTRFDSLDMEVGRLDKKIANEVTAMQAQLEQTAQQINLVEEAIKNLQVEIYKLAEDVKYIEENQKVSY